MGYGDWIFLGVLLVIAVLGAIMGFGKVFSLFVLNKYVRIFVAIFVCYTFGGMILSIPFVNQMLADLASNWSHIKFLNLIHLEIIIYYIGLAIITIVLVIIFAKVVKGVSETNVKVIKILNKLGGVILFGALALILIFLVFQIIAWIGGNTDINFRNTLSQNANAIVGPLYANNPLLKLVEIIKR